MRNFTHLQGHPDLVEITIHNLLEEYQTVTPTEHMLVHQLIHLQLSFIQIETFFNQHLLEGKQDPGRAYLAVLSELDRIPARMVKIIKAIKELTNERSNRKIEPIEDPPLVETLEQYVASHNLPPIRPAPDHPVSFRVHLPGILPSPHYRSKQSNHARRTHRPARRFRPLVRSNKAELPNRD